MSSEQPVILYVDDDGPNRTVFEHTVSHRFRVVTASSGEEALVALAKHEVGVLVTDQRMPGMSGTELLQRVKKTHPATVRIVITAYSDLDPILRSVNEGLVARYLLKPWVASELEETLAWAEGAYRLGRESSDAQLRLLRAERLITLGSIHAAVLHDIKSPLAYIAANNTRLAQIAASCPALLGLVQRHGHELSPEERSDLTELATDLAEITKDTAGGCQVIASLAESVRALLRGAKKGEEAADTVGSVDLAMSICRRLGDPPQSEILYVGPRELPPVALSSTELTQLLINLLSNAAQAVKRKTPPIGKVVLSSRLAPDVLRLIVTDNGPGMPPDVLDKAGRLFFTTREEGTGLGLYQCRRITEGAGGRLDIESEVGVGTTITVTLPRARHPAST